MLTLFRILTFILIPIAVLFGFMDVIFLFGALANTAFLLGFFVLGCFVIYVFASLKFMNTGIDRGAPCKPSLRDWIRVNAFVSIYMSVSTILTCLRYFFTDKNTMRTEFEQMLSTQANVPKMVNADLLYSIMRGSLYFMFLVSIVLLVHIIINFTLLKRYKHLFERLVEPNDN